MKHLGPSIVVALLSARLLPVVSAGPLAEPVSAQATTLDATSCAALPGTWNKGSKTCTVAGGGSAWRPVNPIPIMADLTIPAGTTLHNTGTGVFETYALLALQGTITNDGTIRNHCGAPICRRAARTPATPSSTRPAS